MGRVFSPEQIQNGQVPEVGAHEHAAEEILDGLFETIRAENDTSQSLQLFEPRGNGVDSAMVYGSTAYGTAGRRSDLDVLIFYNPSQEVTALRAIAGVLDDVGSRHSVPVEPNILPVGAVYSDREHGMEPLFVQHLLEISQRGDGQQWLRHNPTSGLQRIADRAEEPGVVSGLAHGYVSNRRNYFAKALVEGGDTVNYNALQRAFEMPSAIGRKAVAATMHEDDEPLDLSSRPSMEARARKALSWFVEEDIGGDKEAVAAHDRLYAMDRQYTTVLERTIAGELSLADYDNWIRSRISDALEGALVLSQRWTDILRVNDESVRRRTRLAAAVSPSGNLEDFFSESPSDTAVATKGLTPVPVGVPEIVDDFPGGGSYS